jgi:hypothetical protein
MSEISSTTSPTIPYFDPNDGIVVADVFPNPGCEPEDPEAPAVISVGLNPANLAFVYLAVDPAGEAVLARLGEEFRLTDAIWLDLHPAEALELARRLGICAEAAAVLDRGDPEEIAAAFGTDAQEVDA